MRIIITSIGSPSYFLAQYIQNILSTYLPKPKSYIEDSKHLKDLLNKINFPNNYELISLDMSSLFTNIPRELVTAAIEKRFLFIEPHCKIPKHEFINCVILLMESTCFQMQNGYYEQTYGTPMECFTYYRREK